MTQIQQIFQFLIEQFRNIANLYTLNFLLASTIAILILGRLVNILRRVLP